MPSRKTQRNHRGARNWCAHGPEYWDRLRRDFKACDYHNGGAYSAVEVELGDAGVQELRAGIRSTEAQIQNLEAQRFKRQDRRLGRASRHGGTKKTLDEGS